jgi:hypothetical protein
METAALRGAYEHQPIPLAGLIDGLAENRMPRHTQQLLDLRAAIPGKT